MSGSLSATDLWTLAERLVRFRFDHARFFTLRAENHGFNIRAFSSYEGAMEWLIAG